MAAAGEHLVPVLVQANAGPKTPVERFHRAAGRDLSGLRGAVDLDQMRPESTLDARCQQRAQMHRSRNQRPRFGSVGHGAADIGRIEGPFCAEGVAAQQGEQDGGFKAVHVLCRHRADQRMPPAIEQPEAGRTIQNAARQSAPQFGVGERRSRRAGGEDDRGQLRHRNLRDAPGHRRPVELRIGQSRQRDGAGRVIRQTKGVRRKRDQLPYHLGGVRRWQKAHPAAHQARDEPHGEAIAVETDVQHVAARRQVPLQLHGIGQQFEGSDRHAAPVGNDIVRTGVCEQRAGLHAGYCGLAK